MEEDVKTLRQQQPLSIGTRQLFTISVSVFIALLALATIISVLSGQVDRCILACSLSRLH